MSNIKVIDNFLEKEEFLNIKNILESWDFPWFFQKKINYNHSENDLDCYFTHNIFNQKSGRSSYYNVINPILNKLNFKSLIRVKCNLYPRTKKIEINKSHVDYEFEHKGAIFYINTNDGGTIIEDNKKIDSVENRILFFNSSLLHSSTTTTNSKARININFNYF